MASSDFDSIEDVLAALSKGASELTDLSKSTTGPIKKTGFIPRISVFEPEDAKHMVFYTKEQWEKLPEDKQQEYIATQPERNAVIDKVIMEQKMRSILENMFGEKIDGN